MKGAIYSASAILTLFSVSSIAAFASGQSTRVMTAPLPVTQAPAPAATSPITKAPPPVMQNPNAPQRDVEQPGPEQFTALAFSVATGDDDLRGDSAAWVDFNFSDGSKQKCLLKDYGGDSWGNNTVHDNDIPQCKLQQPRTLDELKKADILLIYDGTFHVNDFETSDNWNVNEVRITAQDFVQRSFPCLIDAAGHPLVRLKWIPSQVESLGSEHASGYFDLSQTPSSC